MFAGYRRSFRRLCMQLKNFGRLQGDARIKLHQYLRPLLVRYGGAGRADVDQLHHAAVFVAEDVAVENVCPGKIYEPSPHRHPALHRNREIIPPNPGGPHWHARVPQSRIHVSRVKPPDYLKRINVDVERMRRPSCNGVIKQVPLFSLSEFHELVYFTTELLVVDRVHRGRIWHQRRRGSGTRNRVPSTRSPLWRWCGGRC